MLATSSGGQPASQYSAEGGWSSAGTRRAEELAYEGERIAAAVEALDEALQKGPETADQELTPDVADTDAAVDAEGSNAGAGTRGTPAGGDTDDDEYGFDFTPAKR